VQIVSTVLAAQRSGSARAASSGPTALPSPRQADNFYFLFIKFCHVQGLRHGKIGIIKF
jgi:hypothetical protein